MILSVLLLLLLLCSTTTGFTVHVGPHRASSCSSSSSSSTTLLFAKPKKPIPEPTDGTIMPANLKRKIRAKRPALGHVVPTGMGGSMNPQLRPQGKAREAGLNNPSLLKILGGTAKGRRLDSPQVYLRPMMGKVKEAVFSTFTSLGVYDGGFLSTRHLDIFSGSGSVGLESLSRGATHCTFVDFSDDCCSAATRNMEWCFENDDTKSSQVVCADFLQALRDPASVGIDPNIQFQIVTLCPPYEEVVYADLLEAVANSPVVGDDTVILVEYPVELQTLPHVIRRTDTEDGEGGALIGIRNRKYGRTVIAMYICNPTGNLPGAESRPEEFV